MKFSRLALLPLSLVLLTGCDTVRETLGLEHSGPNEFDVATSAPLSMPPDYNLRPPEPGAARPQDVPADVQAQKMLLGDAATTTRATAPASGGESALLQQVGSAPTAVTTAELSSNAKAKNPQQDHLEKVLFNTPSATAAATAPAIDMEQSGSWFDWF